MKQLEMEVMGGNCISDACEKAVALAQLKSRPVHFEFNGTHVIAQPGEDARTVEARWSTDYDSAAKAYSDSPEHKERQEREAEELRRKMAAPMKESASTESEMRDAKVPWPLTKEQLVEYVQSLVDRSHDYGTCVYAMSMAAVAAFNYAAHVVGSSGFQASCADLDIIRRTRSMDGPFMIIKAEDALYPQYDLPGKLQESLTKWQPWLRDEAVKKLAETKHSHAHPDVVAHWKKLANSKAEVG